MHSLPTDLASIESRIRAIDPVSYAASRNYKDGAVTRLSPYISRGVISTKQVFEHIKTLGLPWYKVEKLVQELAWRDYWQQVWIAKGEEIELDLKNPQAPISNYQIPAAIVHAETGIEEVDNAIKELYETGYMHNHMRMYVASICCNVANSHWLQPARWLYSHLLDGDLASNHLSWQWVAGAFSSKKYYANQWNINTYFKSDQKGTFLDVKYEEFEHLEIPSNFLDTVPFQLETVLPSHLQLDFKRDKKTLIYNYYNLDPHWYQGEDVQRIFLLEPSFFRKNPVSQKCLDFALDLSVNIQGIQIFVGEFQELAKQINTENIIYKEHPTNAHYQGHAESRHWLSSVKGYYPSFFAFWKKCKKEIRYESEKGE
ncbi:deoxyribodipyrimidine photo-lyase [Algoriphagus locisalis]|uniref:Deoxyribodipyrimidine photo-lyase n=1 Tax=Algoriphagus locisalis TaxID=305507 RepID=A0A1I7BS26_9BACT|nr:FAD-binding domain-containing protein [Algoriphagus locisalis]SFT89997.1 deoxyribodipyrimidine photo-lyase [Algoriphagus locisalis]